MLQLQWGTGRQSPSATATGRGPSWSPPAGPGRLAGDLGEILMSDNMASRRQFVRGVLVGGAALGLGLRPTWAADVTGKPEAGKIGDFKISLAEWSLHKALFAKKIDNLDFPKIAREQYGIEGVEFVNQFFKDKAHDSAYLKDLKKPGRRPRRDLRPDHDRRRGRPERHGQGRRGTRPSRTTRSGSTPPRPWAATRSGSTPASNYSPTDVGAVAEACGALAEYGAKHKINVICENHGGPSSNPDALLALIKAVEQARTSAPCPTSATSPRTARQVHDRHLRRDRPDDALRQGRLGQELRLRRRRATRRTLDYARIMKIVTDAGYHGYVGIEYEGEPAQRARGDQGHQAAARARGDVTPASAAGSHSIQGRESADAIGCDEADVPGGGGGVGRAGRGPGGGPQEPTAKREGPKPKLAALTTVYHYLSHAYHIVGRFLDGFPVHDGRGLHRPDFEIASLFIEQTPARPTSAGPRPRGTASG